MKKGQLARLTRKKDTMEFIINFKLAELSTRLTEVISLSWTGSSSLDTRQQRLLEILVVTTVIIIILQFSQEGKYKLIFFQFSEFLLETFEAG